MKRLVLIDGHSLLFRAYHALPKTFHNSDGIPTNAVYGFMSMLIRLTNDLNPDYMSVAFDETGPTFRHQELVSYKEGRPEPEEDFSVQNPMIRRVLSAFKIPVYSISGYEGEDIIATVVAQIQKSIRQLADKNQKDGGLEIFIVSGDRDVIQLIDGNIKVYYPRKGLSDTVVYDESNAREVFGVVPSKVPDYKGLRGDASDRIPGVFGIGEKTAVELINEYGSIENLYQKIGTVKDKFGESVAKKLAAGAEMAVLSKRMGQITDGAPLTVKLSDLAFTGFKKEEGLRELSALGFKSLIKRIKPAPEKKSPAAAGQASLW